VGAELLACVEPLDPNSERRHKTVRTLYVVVRPEAGHHIKGVVGGWHDSRLTPAGERVAAVIADGLRARIPVERY
jgi:broad specificity phosphatase PhoE